MPSSVQPIWAKGITLKSLWGTGMACGASLPDGEGKAKSKSRLTSHRVQRQHPTTPLVRAISFVRVRLSMLWLLAVGNGAQRTACLGIIFCMVKSAITVMMEHNIYYVEIRFSILIGCLRPPFLFVIVILINLKFNEQTVIIFYSVKSDDCHQDHTGMKVAMRRPCHH